MCVCVCVCVLFNLHYCENLSIDFKGHFKLCQYVSRSSRREVLKL